MLYQQINSSPVTADVKMSATQNSLSIELKNAVPGLIIFCFGAGGLILLAFKIPVHEVLGYRAKGGLRLDEVRRDEVRLGFGIMSDEKELRKHAQRDFGMMNPETEIRHTAMLTREKVISKDIISLPLPIWWLLRRTGKFEKVLSRTAHSGSSKRGDK
jgi:hypothetical protein